MSQITLAYDKDFIGTILRISTPDGNVLFRKENEEYLNFEYLKPFIGCDVVTVETTKENPSVDLGPSKLIGKLSAINLDEKETAKANRNIYYLYTE
jgi:hypothetical protein